MSCERLPTTWFVIPSNGFPYHPYLVRGLDTMMVEEMICIVHFVVVVVVVDAVAARSVGGDTDDV